MSNEQDLRYPIGTQAQQPYALEPFSEKLKVRLIRDIQFLPQLLESSILNLDEEQLLTPYRPGGWTVQQVVHHVPDSHINAYMRFKLALTESNPVIKPYDEAAWALLPDSALVPVNVSLTLLHALHVRWCEVLKNMQEPDWQKTLVHPEHPQTFTLWDMLKQYAWHGRHHTAHINNLRSTMGW